MDFKGFSEATPSFRHGTSPRRRALDSSRALSAGWLVEIEVIPPVTSASRGSM